MPAHAFALHVGPERTSYSAACTAYRGKINVIIPGVQRSLIRHYYPQVHLCRLRGEQGVVLARVFGLVARLNGMCPAGIAAFPFMLIWPPVRRAAGGLLGAV